MKADSTCLGTNELEPHSDWPSLRQHSRHLCLPLPPFVALYFARRSTEQLKWESPPFWTIQENESHRKVTETTHLIRPSLFKGRTKGLPPSFPINLHAPPHTGNMATSVAHVTYLIRLWGPLPMGDGDIQWGGAVSISPWSLTDKRWVLIFVPGLTDAAWMHSW